MHVLALDTTTPVLTAALLDGDGVVGETIGNASRSTAEQLPRVLCELLENAHLEVRAVGLFAVAAGPGSFTGLRVGIATMQGFAYATGRPLVLISALEALAQAHALEVSAGGMVGSWINAHRRDVFSALYEIADAPAFSSARLIERAPPMVATPADTLSLWHATAGLPAAIVGDGTTAYATVIPASIRAMSFPVLATSIAFMALSRFRDGHAPSPHAAQPLYVRRPDAEIAREKRAGASESSTSG